MKNKICILSILLLLSKNSISQFNNCESIHILGTKKTTKECFYLESIEEIQNLKNKNVGIYFTYEIKNSDSILIKLNTLSAFKEKFIVDSLNIFICKKIFKNKIKKESKILFDKKNISFVMKKNLNIYIVMEYQNNYSNAFVFKCEK